MRLRDNRNRPTSFIQAAMNTTSETVQQASLHIVCPHCDAVNRVPSTRLGQAPTCGKCQKELFTGQPTDLGSARFLKHIERSDIPVLVDFIQC
jgi:thioredoxin 2